MWAEWLDETESLQTWYKAMQKSLIFSTENLGKWLISNYLKVEDFIHILCCVLLKKKIFHQSRAIVKNYKD